MTMSLAKETISDFGFLVLTVYYDYCAFAVTSTVRSTPVAHSTTYFVLVCSELLTVPGKLTTGPTNNTTGNWYQVLFDHGKSTRTSDCFTADKVWLRGRLYRELVCGQRV